MKKFFAALALPLLLAACAVPPPTPSEGRIAVAATFYPLAFVAQQVGGDRVDVIQITPGGVEPHDYEPTPQQLARIQSAKIFLLNGAGIDPWAEKMRDELSSKGIATLTETEHAVLLPGVPEGETGATAGSASDVSDPHVWLDPVLLREFGADVMDALIRVDPFHAEAYKRNMEAFASRLSALDAAYRDGLASCGSRAVISSHNAFKYFAKLYGLTMIPISGLSPEEEPSPKRMGEIADLARDRKIDTIFFETLASPKLSETIASEIGAKTAVLNPLEGITEEERAAGKDYVTIMEENLKNLRAALRCK